MAAGSSNSSRAQGLAAAPLSFAPIHCVTYDTGGGGSYPRDERRWGVARLMTPEERRAFLLRGTRTAILATRRPDGRPHAVPVGFVLDDEDVLFLTGESTVKAANLQHDPR